MKITPFHKPAEQPTLETYVPFPFKEYLAAMDSKQKVWDDTQATYDKAYNNMTEEFERLDFDIPWKQAQVESFKKKYNEIFLDGNLDITSPEVKKKVSSLVSEYSNNYQDLVTARNYKSFPTIAAKASEASKKNTDWNTSLWKIISSTASSGDAEMSGTGKIISLSQSPSFNTANYLYTGETSVDVSVDGLQKFIPSEPTSALDYSLGKQPRIADAGVESEGENADGTIRTKSGWTGVRANRAGDIYGVTIKNDKNNPDLYRVETLLPGTFEKYVGNTPASQDYKNYSAHFTITPDINAMSLSEQLLSTKDNSVTILGLVNDNGIVQNEAGMFNIGKGNAGDIIVVENAGETNQRFRPITKDELAIYRRGLEEERLKGEIESQMNPQIAVKSFSSTTTTEYGAHVKKEAADNVTTEFNFGSKTDGKSTNKGIEIFNKFTSAKHGYNSAVDAWNDLGDIVYTQGAKDAISTALIEYGIDLNKTISKDGVFYDPVIHSSSFIQNLEKIASDPSLSSNIDKALAKAASVNTEVAAALELRPTIKNTISNLITTANEVSSTRSAIGYLYNASGVEDVPFPDLISLMENDPKKAANTIMKIEENLFANDIVGAAPIVSGKPFEAVMAAVMSASGDAVVFKDKATGQPWVDNPNLEYDAYLVTNSHGDIEVILSPVGKIKDDKSATTQAAKGQNIHLQATGLTKEGKDAIVNSFIRTAFPALTNSMNRAPGQDVNPGTKATLNTIANFAGSAEYGAEFSTQVFSNMRSGDVQKSSDNLFMVKKNNDNSFKLHQYVVGENGRGYYEEVGDYGDAAAIRNEIGLAMIMNQYAER